MNIHRFRRSILDHEVESLQGYLELGMKRQSLVLAKRLIRRRKLTARAFNEILSAILIQADNLSRWQPWVELAYDHLPGESQSQVRFQMLGFYVACENWSSAEKFVPEWTEEPSEFLLAMWTLLERRRMTDARRLYRLSLKAWRNRGFARVYWVKSDFSALSEALGCYHAQMGQWCAAERWWKLGARLQPFDDNALEGLLKLQAVRALAICKDAQKQLAVADEEAELHEEFPLIFHSPKRPKKEPPQVRKFRKYESYLARIIPDSERFRYNAVSL